MRIPNWLTLSFAPAGVALHSGINGIGGLQYSAAGIAAGFLPLLLLYMFGGIGAGDVKLFAAAGAWMGCVQVAELMMYSFLYGGAGAAAYYAWRFFARALAGRASSAAVSSLSEASSDDLRRIWMWILLLPTGASAFRSRVGEGAAVKFPFMAAVFPGALTLLLMG